MGPPNSRARATHHSAPPRTVAERTLLENWRPGRNLFSLYHAAYSSATNDTRYLAKSAGSPCHFSDYFHSGSPFPPSQCLLFLGPRATPPLVFFLFLGLTVRDP